MLSSYKDLKHDFRSGKLSTNTLANQLKQMDIIITPFLDKLDMMNIDINLLLEKLHIKDQVKKDSPFWYTAKQYFNGNSNGGAAYRHDHRRRAQNDGRATTDIMAALDGLMHGPINKTDATRLIEAILEKIDENSQIRFEDGDYILTLENEDINLSLLINNANLSHLTLDEKLIEKLYKKFKNLLEKSKLQHYSIQSQSPLFDLLHPIQKIAFKIYSLYGYININQFFRHEKLTSDAIVKHEDHPQNMLVAFILGCLINDAINKIPSLVDNLPLKKKLNQLAYHYQIEISELDTEEKYEAFLENALTDEKITPEQYQELQKQFNNLVFLFPKRVVLDRGETINQEVIDRRINNSTRYPALTSFSKHEKGCPLFDNPEGTRTKLHNSPNYYVVMNSIEEEVILPQGTQVIAENINNCLIATFVRSPALEPGDHYHSDLALRCVFSSHLVKTYQDEKGEINMNGTTIYRPNHGLAHTYRVMIGIELVIQYFAHYALDPEFRMFCQQLSPKDIEWLRVAAAFSVSGRESEGSAKNNLELAESYRQKSAEYFSQYVNKNSFFNEKDMQERITSIVRFMGNPYYENKLNDHPDEKERTLRNFYFRILTIAHKLDLVRCYTPSQYMEAMKVCGEWSVKSDAQSKAYKEMIKYSIDLIKAHGDTLCCALDLPGQFAPEFQSYKPIFAEVSLSLKRAREVAETVAKPRILFQPMPIENRV